MLMEDEQNTHDSNAQIDILAKVVGKIPSSKSLRQIWLPVIMTELSEYELLCRNVRL